ncbi:28S ribosomal protein S35, mitochondrial [Rissa tridactyla]|uniref:28S ribosomal protein S35, mitochondrial n=1 Tax=Rissa tridactyla TaxID=75485 RepID=UPI0023BAA64B|nr:28S ribosomal protein S35, mitochondrial [Rissa tridactyla]XP_054054700.1 28S ribosomal protein S35, mitochondrial [Rissa tridactyla]XP_054054706.1 28S ribosomal protein S35, mitochondrial [Rissa tridactyla]XP_054054713.1 28S ribosomal protein S35, mitochondrial [Rissa tridactyla]XP_054054722.1 28S ribosomal protein S35, mitochondrial [Rissa tridactyla]XP_054054731.1 28S ribosomal protein S35, mitochondrial [Rissa tridactyla]XP_054054740.1 28S ribosomal protein S35, mitochondrial [Rissa tr
MAPVGGVALAGAGYWIVLSRCCGRVVVAPFFGAAAYSSVPAVEGQQREASTRRRGRTPQFHAPPRTERMAVDQDWSSVYPTAAVFKPASVPLPIRMGYPVKRGVPPPKEGNLELMKIPNFLHLTPPAIKKHCAALKDFCTEWPSALDSDEKCEQHFPIEIETVDYVSSGTSIRNPKARVVTLKVKLSNLNLDDHAKKKLIKLVGERYCKDTDMLTITTDRCPLRRQNYDYGIHLLTVLYHESWKTEMWESEKSEEDMEEYIWENSRSQKNMLDTLLRIKASENVSNITKEELLASEVVKNYRNSVIALKNEGETEYNMSQYKESVKKLLNIQALP